MITYAEDDEIRRESAGSREGKNSTNLSRGEFARIWNRLRSTGTVEHKAHRFALALICRALPDLVEFAGGATVEVRRRHIFVTEVDASSPYVEMDARERRWPQYRDYNEGLDHFATKHFIAEHADQALSSLSGSPWGQTKLEVVLDVPTRDRVDVLVYDHDNVPVVIEVKPYIGVNNIDYYAQAAKYRAIWQVLAGVPSDWVRCVLAAPRVTEDKTLQTRMLEKYNIETVNVDVPGDYKEAKRSEWERECRSGST